MGEPHWPRGGAGLIMGARIAAGADEAAPLTPEAPMAQHGPSLFDRAVARTLTGLGLLLALQALSKPVLLALGARAPGRIVSEERGVSTRGAYRVRYQFTARDGRSHQGSAFTAVRDARPAPVAIAYLPVLPAANMPASGGYAAVAALGWGLAALLALAAGRVLGRR